MFWLAKKFFGLGFKTIFLLIAIGIWLVGCGTQQSGTSFLGFLGVLFHIFVLWTRCRKWWWRILRTAIYKRKHEVPWREAKEAIAAADEEAEKKKKKKK